MHFADILITVIAALVFNKMALIFTVLHGMQMRSYDEISVRLSVCLSVRLSNVCIVIKRKNQSRFLYHAKEHSL